MRKSILIASALAASLVSFSALAQASKGPSDVHQQHQGMEEKQAYKELRKEQYKKKSRLSEKDCDAMYKQMHRHTPKSLDKLKDFGDYGKKKRLYGKGNPDFSAMSKEEKKAYRAAWHKKKMAHASRKTDASQKTKSERFSHPELEAYFKGIKKLEGKMDAKDFSETRKERRKQFKGMTADERSEARFKLRQKREIRSLDIDDEQ